MERTRSAADPPTRQMSCCRFLADLLSIPRDVPARCEVRVERKPPPSWTDRYTGAQFPRRGIDHARGCRFGCRFRPIPGGSDSPCPPCPGTVISRNCARFRNQRGAPPRGIETGTCPRDPLRFAARSRKPSTRTQIPGAASILARAGVGRRLALIRSRRWTCSRVCELAAGSSTSRSPRPGQSPPRSCPIAT